MLNITNLYPEKRAFITGGGSGLGEAYALQLAADGWTVGIADMRQESLDQAAEKIQQAGGKPLAYCLDVRDRETYQSVIDDFIGAAGGIDLLVNNAGVAGGGALGEYTIDDWDWIMGINVMGVVNGCHYFLPHFKKQQSGMILNTASAAAFSPVPKMSAYCAGKAAVKMFSEVLYNELHADGIRVSVVMPEFFRTNLHVGARGPEVEQAKYLLVNAPYTADQVARQALDQAADGRLHIVFGKEANVIWRIMRWFPMFGLGRIRKELNKREEKVNRELARQNN